MPNHSIIPRNIKAFNLFITQTCAYLILGTPTNAVRFNWTAANLTAWQAFLTAWNPKYLLYANRKGGYTTDIKTDLEAIIANAVLYAHTNKLIELIRATVSLNALDCSTFNLPATLAVVSTGGLRTAVTTEANKTIATTELVYPKLIPTAGGFVQVLCFTEVAKSGRSHKLEGYDLVEHAVGVFYLGSANLPTHATDGRLTTAHSSKAGYILPTASLTANLTALTAGTVEPAKIAVFFFRWSKSKHPEHDGPWSGPFTTPLL
jgi:hypothetical protein